MDSYTFNTPIGFLTIREEEQKLTNLFWQADSERVLKNERHSDFLYEVYIQVNEYFGDNCRRFHMGRREVIRRLRLVSAMRKQYVRSDRQTIKIRL